MRPATPTPATQYGQGLGTGSGAPMRPRPPVPAGGLGGTPPALPPSMAQRIMPYVGGALTAGGLGYGAYKALSGDGSSQSGTNTNVLSGDASPAEKADAARMAKEAETAAAEKERLNPSKLTGSMPSGGMTSKEYDAYLNQALNNRNSSINQGLQGMMRERQRQMDNDYNRVRDAEMTRQNALPQPSVMNPDGSVREARMGDKEYRQSSMGDRVRNTATDNALAWHSKQNGIDATNNYNAGVQSGQLNASGTPTQESGNRTIVDDFTDALNPYQQALNAGGPLAKAAGASGAVGSEGDSIGGDIATAAMNAGMLSDEAMRIAGVVKNEGGIANAAKAIVSGRGNLAGVNASGGGAALNKGIQGLSAVQGLHGASKELFGKGFGDLFEDDSTASALFGGNDPTSEGRRSNAYGNMQNRLMDRMGMSDKWKSRFNTVLNPINKFQGTMDAFADPFTGGGLDVVRGTMASLMGDDKFARESGYDMDPLGTGRLMNRMLKTTPSWQKTKFNGQLP